MKRVGLFGGTFDPVHLGHVAMIRSALGHGLERVVVMPCRVSPHKRPEEGNTLPAAAEHRLAMLQLALDGMAQVEISQHELERPGLSYTWQTLEYLNKICPGVRWVLILGMDQYKALPQWDRFGDWSGSVDFLLFRRQGVDPEICGGPGGLAVEWAGEDIPGVAASKVRDLVRGGESIGDLVPLAVADYIKSHELYRKKGG